VLVTLPSRAERRSGMQMAIKDRQKPGPRFHAIEGMQDRSEGGRVGRLNFSFTTYFDTSLSVDVVHVEAVAVEEPDAREDGLEGCSLGAMLKMYFRKMDLEDKINALNEAGWTSLIGALLSIVGCVGFAIRCWGIFPWLIKNFDLKRNAVLRLMYRSRHATLQQLLLIKSLWPMQYARPRGCCTVRNAAKYLHRRPTLETTK
jgi:hypothetical protein